jgi:hypothetical protein
MTIEIQPGGRIQVCAIRRNALTVFGAARAALGHSGRARLKALCVDRHARTPGLQYYAAAKFYVAHDELAFQFHGQPF